MAGPPVITLAIAAPVIARPVPAIITAAVTVAASISVAASIAITVSVAVTASIAVTTSASPFEVEGGSFASLLRVFYTDHGAAPVPRTLQQGDAASALAPGAMH